MRHVDVPGDAALAAKKTEAVGIRMTPTERAIFNRLKVARERELAGEGVEVTDAGIIRWLIAKDATARGPDKEPATAAPTVKPRAKPRAG